MILIYNLLNRGQSPLCSLLIQILISFGDTLTEILSNTNTGHWSPSGFSVQGISQARILERVAIFFSRGSSQPGDQNLKTLSLASPALTCKFFTTEPPGKTYSVIMFSQISGNPVIQSSWHMKWTIIPWYVLPFCQAPSPPLSSVSNVGSVVIYHVNDPPASYWITLFHLHFAPTYKTPTLDKLTLIFLFTRTRTEGENRHHAPAPD